MLDGSKPKEFLNISVETVSVKTETVYVAPDVDYPGEVKLNKIQVETGIILKPDIDSQKTEYNLPDGTFGRSMVENVTQSVVVWQDSWHNKNGVRDIKGGNMRDVYATKNIHHENGVDFMGLYFLNEKKVQELIDVSSALRGQGISVEAISKVDKLQEFPLVKKVGDKIEVVKMLNVDEWKDYLLNRKPVLRDVYSLFRIPNRANVLKTLESEDFYVVTRDMPVAERLWTLLQIKTIKSFHQIVGKQFDWLNVATDNGQTGVSGDESLPKTGRRLDINNPLDINFFYTDYLPKYMGASTAAVHNAGYHMPFGHIQNWTGIGTAVDSEGYGKVDDFDFNIVKNDVWQWLFSDFKTGNPDRGILEIFDYGLILNKFLTGGHATDIFVDNYLNAYRDKVNDPKLKNVKLPFYYKLKYDLF